MRRFRQREEVSYKQHKIAEQDYRNREQLKDYGFAVNDIITRTSTEYSPWQLVEDNDKSC
jgi:AMP-polyphosphate phosphotransferase